MIHHSSKNL